MNPFERLARPILKHFVELNEDDLAFGPSPKLDVGDVAIRTFVAAKKLGIAPPSLAQTIVDEVQFGPEVTGLSAAGPYLNFRLDRGAFAREIIAGVLRQGETFGSDGSGHGLQLLIEHTSINPNASPHVGRARNAMIGDALTRLFRFQGYEATVHYYVNDIGKQIGLLVLHCEDVTTMNFDEILAAYVEANERAQRDPEFAQRGYALLADMERGDPETVQRFKAITDLCLDGQLAVLARLGIKYDVFDRESKYLKDPRLDEVVKALEEKDAVFTDEQERLVVDLSKLGYERDEGRYFVLMRANGSSMYGYRDLAYTIEKMDQGADVNLWVLGEDHTLYSQQQKRILNAAGYEAPEPIYYAYILLQEGKMSTRKGQVVLLSEFLDEAARRAAQKVDQQWDDLPSRERQTITEEVAAAAIRFAILRVGPNKNVIFNWEESLSFSGDTGPYIQYSCARIHSILRKFGDVPTEPLEFFPTDTDSEWRLVTKLATFPDTIMTAVNQRNVAPVAQFALETARLFTTFYHECPVLAAESEELKRARAQVCAATLQTLKNALGVLGINTLERM